MSESACFHETSHAPFDDFAARMQGHFDRTRESHGRSLFTTDADGLYETYLAELPDNERQYHTCHCCKAFIGRFGGLVRIAEDGSTVSACWPDHAPSPYSESVVRLKRIVERARVNGVFLSETRTLGTPEAGGWTHFALSLPAEDVMRPSYKRVHEVMAQKRQDYGTLSHGLSDFSPGLIAQAINLLQADALYRSENVIGPARFLHQLHATREGRRGPHADNIVWRAVASAPAGFCTPRSAMVGTLLDDIRAGYDLDAVTRRFAAKMHPLRYQRPQAPASAGNIARAEKIVSEMGLEPALHRRYARIEEIETIWTPKPIPAAASATHGVFGHLTPKGRPPLQTRPLDAASKAITWARFSRDVLPEARAIEVYMGASMNIAGMLTAVNPEAPPLLRWDRPERRNPVSWYVWHGGSSPADWGLTGGSWVRATGVTLLPPNWSGCPENHTYKEGAIFLLDGAREVRRRPSLCLFPEFLRSELHEVRATIESFSKSRHPEEPEQGTANGLRVGENNRDRIRVTGPLGQTIYTIDRWE